MSLHIFNQRILAEDLVRARRPDDRERYAAAHRQARIDPNPHQIDEVIFALRRLREGGCILADEVALENALSCLIGEKFFNVVDVSKRDPEFATSYQRL